MLFGIFFKFAVTIVAPVWP